jgi:hypothetical protein
MMHSTVTYVLREDNKPAVFYGLAGACLAVASGDADIGGYYWRRTFGSESEQRADMGIKAVKIERHSS